MAGSCETSHVIDLSPSSGRVACIAEDMCANSSILIERRHGRRTMDFVRNSMRNIGEWFRVLAISISAVERAKITRYVRTICVIPVRHFGTLDIFTKYVTDVAELTLKSDSDKFMSTTMEFRRSTGPSNYLHH